MRKRKDKMNASWLDEPKEVYARIGQEYQPPLVMLEDPDTSNLTSSVERMDNILHSAWDVVMRKYADKPKPDVQTFCTHTAISWLKQGRCKPPPSQAPAYGKGSRKWAFTEPQSWTVGASLT